MSITDWSNWEVQVDEEGKLIVVPIDHPFSGDVEPLWDPCLTDGKDDPELDRARRTRIVGT